jgi:hypothetical protein
VEYVKFKDVLSIKDFIVFNVKINTFIKMEAVFSRIALIGQMISVYLVRMDLRMKTEYVRNNNKRNHVFHDSLC